MQNFKKSISPLLVLIFFTIPSTFLFSQKKRPKTFTCLFNYGTCQETFRDQNKYFKHCKITHGHKKDDLEKKSTHHYKKKQNTDPEIKLYTCLPCMKPFLNHATFLIHRQEHKANSKFEFPASEEHNKSGNNLNPDLLEMFNDPLMYDFENLIHMEDFFPILTPEPNADLNFFDFYEEPDDKSETKSLSHNLRDIINYKLPLHPISEYTAEEIEHITNKARYEKTKEKAINFYFSRQDESYQRNLHETVWIGGADSSDENTNQRSSSPTPSSASTISEEEPIPELLNYFSSGEVFCYLCSFIYPNEEYFLDHLKLHQAERRALHNLQSQEK